MHTHNDEFTLSDIQGQVLNILSDDDKVLMVDDRIAPPQFIMLHGDPRADERLYGFTLQDCEDLESAGLIRSFSTVSYPGGDPIFDFYELTEAGEALVADMQAED